ncbi:uncharacterized protein LOC129743901 [Uranotaenia lowii]|uniref:uncharacterized protein LOC129743901 n=1 Tax=Uranotaenia lowii TaxID=190385 RepID=UPI0024788BCB|nr:uncharacterized protein LOC129743901 [Uranotaenia lowii]
MADNEKATKYEEVWSRVKTYIPFLQELINFHKNEITGRPQTLEKITTIYDLLKNQRLNYTSLCKCEGVLIKLYETNLMKKKKRIVITPPVAKQSEVETPASPKDQADPSKLPEKEILCKRDPTRTSFEVGEWSNSIEDRRGQPTLDEIQRLDTIKPKSDESLSDADSNPLDEMKITSKSAQTLTNKNGNDSPVKHLQASSASSNNDALNKEQNVTFSTQPYGEGHWNTDQDSSLPHVVNKAFLQNTESESQQKPPPPHSGRCYDDLILTDDRMDISPDIRSPPIQIPHIKDPRLRKAASNVERVQFLMNQKIPEKYNQAVPQAKVNDPRLNRLTIPPYGGSIPNGLPRCLAPNPYLPLDIPKREPPKRRRSICVNQVIIQEIPPEPHLPVKPFPSRRQSVFEFSNPYDKSPMFQNKPFFASQYSFKAPTISSIPKVHPQSTEQPSVVERDSRKKKLPPRIEHMQQSCNTLPYEKPVTGFSKPPLTYLEHRLLKEKQLQNVKQEPSVVEKSEEPDIMLGMVPNKTRVAARAYAKPVKSVLNKERQSASSPKPKITTPESKSVYKQPHNKRTDMKLICADKQDQHASSLKQKDLFGEQLSQFDKICRIGDISKKSIGGTIGSFKIPKLNRAEETSIEEKSKKSKYCTSSKDISHSSRSNSKTAFLEEASEYRTPTHHKNGKPEQNRKRRCSVAVSQEFEESLERENRPQKLIKRNRIIWNDQVVRSASTKDNTNCDKLLKNFEKERGKIPIAKLVQSTTVAKMNTEDNVVSSTTNESKVSTQKRGCKDKKSVPTPRENYTTDDALAVKRRYNSENSAKTILLKDSGIKTDDVQHNKKANDSTPGTQKKAQLLAMLSKILDKKKVKKIQDIIESPSDKSITSDQEIEKEQETRVSRERISSMCISSTAESIPKDKSSGRARKSELDKLNADINEMYMRDDVLKATGRRRCAQKSEELTLTLARRDLKSPGPAKTHVKMCKKTNIAPKIKNLKVFVKKINISKLQPINRKRKISEETKNDVSTFPIGEASFSPKSKKTRSGSCTSVNDRNYITQTVDSQLEIFITKKTTKNIDRELHCRNPKTRECTLCSYSALSLDTIVQHYVRAHPLHEVFTSRFTNTIANQIKKDPMKITGNLNDKKILTKCLFCQETFTKKRYDWKLHLASHTGEYRYKCINCTNKTLAPSTYGHDKDCAKPALEIANEFPFLENHLLGYMCKLCNYVQLSRDRIDHHLKEQHGRLKTGKGILKFSILNYYLSRTVKKDIESDVSMPELTPQTSEKPINVSDFIATDSRLECGTLTVLSNSSFVSTSEPSILDNLQNGPDKTAQASLEKKDVSCPNLAPYHSTVFFPNEDEEWEDIESPQKQPSNASPKSIEKVEQCLRENSFDICMPIPLAVKKEETDVFEGKQVVSNIGFNRTADVIWYLCLILDCKYSTRNRIEIYEHVDQEHQLNTWDGFCYLCTAQITDDVSNELTKEINHMADVHIEDRSAVNEFHGLLNNVTRENPLDAARNEKPISSGNLSFGLIPSNAYDVPIHLKPWTTNKTFKSREHCCNMLDEKSLYCFFKCMGTRCSFTTTLQFLMEEHMKNHEVADNIQPDKTSKSWLECSYCEFVATDSGLNLVDHLRHSHAQSSYQCRYCFYRSRNSYNVVLHQQLYHSGKKIEILLIGSKEQAFTASDHHILNRRRMENILPLICTVCEEEFFVLDAYMTHLKIEHRELTCVACQCCRKPIQIQKMPRHLLLHNIGIYECLYCQFGSNTFESLKIHVCNKHPMEPFYCCIRFNKGPEKKKHAILKSLSEKCIEGNFIKRCTFTSNELNYKSPDIKSNPNVRSKTTMIPVGLSNCDGDTNIVQDINSINSSHNITHPVRHNSEAADIIQVPTISNIIECSELMQFNSNPLIAPGQDIYRKAIATPSSNVPVIKLTSDVIHAQSSSVLSIIGTARSGISDSITIPPISPLVRPQTIVSSTQSFPIITNVCSLPPSTSKHVQCVSENEALIQEAERIAMEMIKDTGLPRNVIYKCVFKDCDAVLSDSYGMQNHLMFTHVLSTQYNCVHCKTKTSFPSVLTFMQHLKTHEPQRIFCFVCDYKGSFPPDVIMHVKEVHKTNKPTILFLNPKKNDPNSDIIVFAPGQPTEAERKAYYQKLIDLYNHKLPEALLIQQKTQFSPEECEMLPKQAIFSKLVYCNKCHYGTKVRLNMYRHLKGHLNDIPVANVDPKNPVFCWEHFDHMKDSATSPQKNDTLNSSLCFVHENQRYLCGVCRFLAFDECLFQSHLNTWHRTTVKYKCPHCPVIHVFSSGKFDASKIGDHLKLHGRQLYRCSICNIFLDNKNNMKHHVHTNHSHMSEASICVVRNLSEENMEFKWKCDICEFQCVSIHDIKTHMINVHKLMTRYRCAKCFFGASNKDLFFSHFEEKHPGSEIGIVPLYKAINGNNSRIDTTLVSRPETVRAKSVRCVEIEEGNDTNVGIKSVIMSEIGDSQKPGPSRHPLSTPTVALPKPVQSRFDYFFKYACFYCTLKTDTISELKEHWRTTHTVSNLPSPEKPFLFKTSKIILCFYCRIRAVMPQMKTHVAQCHPNMQPIYLDFRNPNQCAECDYCTNQKQEMILHYSEHHQHESEYAKGWISYLNDNILNKILEFESTIFRCAEYTCDFTTDSSSDFVPHYTIFHSGQHLKFNKETKSNKEIKFHCSFNNCKTSFTEARNVANHLMIHVPMFKCCCDPSCNISCRSFAMLVQHYRANHSNQDLKYALKTPNEYHTVLRMISIQFWNGFVMTLEDALLANNRFGVNSEISKYVNDICYESVAETNLY